MGRFLGVSSLFKNFLVIFLFKENRFLTFCVYWLCVPSNIRVLCRCGVCMACGVRALAARVTDTWASSYPSSQPDRDGVTVLGPRTEKEGGTEVRARGDRHYFMEFWLGLSTNLVRCSEDDGRRKKRGAYDRSEGGGERGSERENIKTGDDGVLCRDWRREITTH